ncbi:MAG: hypothetical protein ABUL41_01925 [Chitinophagaceae bacterium]
MKIRKINILLAVSLGAIIAFSGCKKDDGAIRKSVSISDVPTITTNIDPTGSQAIDLLNPTTFAGKFKVDIYFPGTTPPSKIDVVVRKSNGTVNNNNVKLYKAAVATFPASFTITAAELATLFGAPITLGDAYDFAPDIYVGERKFEAFPAIGAGTGAGLNGQPFFGEFARFSAICAYDPAIYQGNFVVVSDAFQDFSPGEVVPITKIDNTHFSFIDPYVTNPLPVIVTVNTANNQLTIAKQKIGNAFTWNLGYTNPNMEATASTSSFVAPCSKTIDLNITYTVDQGTFGAKLLRLKKP